MRAARLLAFGVGIAVGLFAALPRPAAAEDAEPRFVEVPCDPAGLAPGIAARLRCGTVAVPRLQGNPDAGTYRLKVTVLKAATQPAQPDAVILLPGGPGEASLGPPAYAELMATFPDRDVVLADPRGTGASEPRLCAGFNMFDGRFVGPSHTGAQLHAALAEAARACLAEGAARGIAPAEFSARANAEDADFVRRALGYRLLDVVGTSYGAVTALELATRHPETIRALVLNSPYIGTLSPLSGDENWARARQALFAECERDTLCAAAYPELGIEIDKVLTGLRDKPLAIPMPPEFGAPGNVVQLDPVDFETVLFGMSYDPATSARIPALVRATAQGRTAPVADALMQGKQRGDSLAAFVHYAVLCQDGSAAHEAGMLGPGGGEDLGISLATAAPVCGAFAGSAETPDLPSGERIPILTLSGLLDPIVPPANARTIGALLGPVVRQVEFSSIGHGVAPQSRCGVGLVQQFFANPTGPIDASCLRDVPPVAFRPPSG